MRYKPWGEVRYSWTAGLSTMPAYMLPEYTFTGQFSYMDDPTTTGVTEGFDLMFYNARWYDPALGRFAQADTIVPGGVQGYDRYAYVNNNPVKYVDPSGHCSQTGDNWCFEDNPYKKGSLQRDDIKGQAGVATGPSFPIDIINTAKNITLDNGTHWSLGTLINSNTILTHNHFNAYNNDHPVETLTVDGHFAAYSDAIGLDVGGNGPQTRLLTFDNEVSGTPAKLGSQTLIASLTNEDTVQVIYWDDTNSRTSIGLFGIKEQALNGYIVLDDPLHIIGYGDSGGGVFYEDQLIGNVQGINSPDIVFVATLPSQDFLTQFSSAISPLR